MHIKLCIATAVLTAAAVAQQPGATQSVKVYSSSSDVAAMIAKAKAGRKENQPIVTDRILQLAPYSANLEYRASVGPAAVHEKEAEMFYVIDGSATMGTGGKLAGETRTKAENLSGSGSDNGRSPPVAKGGLLSGPEKPPHWVSQITGGLILE